MQAFEINISYKSPTKYHNKREAYNSETTIVEGGCLCPTVGLPHRQKKGEANEQHDINWCSWRLRDGK